MQTGQNGNGDGNGQSEPHRLTGYARILLTRSQGDDISIEDILNLMRDRAYGVLISLFALPAIIPLPLGLSAIFGAPLMYLTALMVLGFDSPLLPRKFLSLKIPRKEMKRFLIFSLPWLIRAEKFLTPRLLPLSDLRAERVIGAICLVLAVCIFLPIPLGNTLPAIAIILMGLGIATRDGISILVGGVLSLVAIAIVVAVIYAGIKIALLAISAL